MKKFILLYFIIYVFSYANYLITNSEIVLFYSENNKSIEYIRGDIFNNTSISSLDFKLILDNKKILSLNDKIKDVNIIKDTNILELTYEINGNEIKIIVVPSMNQKGKLYFLVDLSKFYIEQKKVDFVIGVVPQYDNRFINIKNGIVTYDNFSFRSENYEGNLYLARNSQIEDFTLEKIEKRTKKYGNDKIYFIINDIFKEKNIIFDFNFYNNFSLVKSSENLESILEKEFNYWNIEKKNERIKGNLLNQMVNLELITSRAVIPNEISFNKSQENLDNKMKLYFTKSMVTTNFNSEKLFEDINLKKRDSESVLYYTLLYEYLNIKNLQLDKKLFERKVSLEVLSLLDYIELDNNQIINIRDNIRDYFWYFKLLDNIKDREEFKNEKDFILEKERILREYVNKNYVLSSGLKTRVTDNQSFYKNIKYIDFMPKSYQLKLLDEAYRKYYDKNYNLLIPIKDGKKIDLEYNLNYIIKLYQNKKYKLANSLFETVENEIKKNNNYLLPKIDLNKNTMVGIYGEMLYLYFKAFNYREKYYNGNNK